MSKDHLEELLKAATPGPWVVLHEPDGDDLPWSVEQAGDGFSICGMYAYAGKSDPQEANARLIALAPELAAALIEAERALAGSVAEYDRVHYMRTADYHGEACNCMRCWRDRQQATLARIRAITGETNGKP